MPFVSGGDHCLSMFREVYETGALVFPLGASVLEIGCAEADWMTPMLAERPDLVMTGIDWRACERPGVVIQGDVLTHDFPLESFDAIVGISSIEHVGLGHYEHDPLDVDGDVRCMARARTWLKPGGWVYADVPCEAAYRVAGSEYRAYDVEALMARLVGPLTVKGRWYLTPTATISGEPPAPNERGFNYLAFCAVKES